MKKVNINIAVKNLDSSVEFYKALVFEKQEDFSDENGVGMKWSNEIFVMLLTHDFAKNFIEDRAFANSHEVFSSLFSFELESVQEVDKIVEKAKSVNARTFKNKINEQFDFMYGTSIVDPDGNILEMFYMDTSKFPSK